MESCISRNFLNLKIDLSTLQQTLATVAHIQMAEYKICSTETSKTMTRIKSTEEKKNVIYFKNTHYFDKTDMLPVLI